MGKGEPPTDTPPARPAADDSYHFVTPPFIPLTFFMYHEFVQNKSSLRTLHRRSMTLSSGATNAATENTIEDKVTENVYLREGVRYLSKANIHFSPLKTTIQKSPVLLLANALRLHAT